MNTREENPAMEQFLTIDEVADHLRVSVLTIRWLRQEGRFAPATKVGRRLVWEIGDVKAWAKSQREDSEAA
ncbi:MAG: helix-turn-helix transcriptional regulator [Nocardioidaceae bacterium]